MSSKRCVFLLMGFLMLVGNAQADIFRFYGDTAAPVGSTEQYSTAFLFQDPYDSANLAKFSISIKYRVKKPNGSYLNDWTSLEKISASKASAQSKKFDLKLSSIGTYRIYFKFYDNDFDRVLDPGQDCATNSTTSLWSMYSDLDDFMSQIYGSSRPEKFQSLINDTTASYIYNFGPFCNGPVFKPVVLKDQAFEYSTSITINSYQPR